jgi:hypothetical protein
VLPNQMPHLPGRTMSCPEEREARRLNPQAAARRPNPVHLRGQLRRDDGYDPADDDNLPNLCLDSEDNNNDDELEEGDCILYTVFTPAKEIRAGSTVSQRLTRRILQLPEPRSHLGPRISRMSSPGSPLTLSRTGGREIMPLNLSRTRNRPTARSTQSPRLSRRSSIASSRRD